MFETTATMRQGPAQGRLRPAPVFSSCAGPVRHRPSVQLSCRQHSPLEQRMKSARTDSRSFLLAMSSLLGVLCNCVSGYAQAVSTKPIRVNSEMVNVYAVVENRGGRLIRDLNQQDFAITDNKVPQQIAFFSRETDAPLSLGVLIDTSVSQERLLSTEQQTTQMFLASVLRRSDRAFFMHFDTDVELLVDFTNDLGSLSRAVEQVRINETGQSVLANAQTSPPPGGTHLYDAVYLASNELMKSREGRKVLVLVTDGEDQGSRSSLAASLAAAEKADVIVYSIIVSDPDFYAATGTSYHGSRKMRELSRQTGGRMIRVESIAGLGKAFEQVASELRSQYLLGYIPSNLARDGSFRAIRVQVRGHNYAVKTRRGYYALSE
jgi:VWFA-related protein